MYYAVALLHPPYSTLTYSAPPSLPHQLWKTGIRVAVPLGGSALRTGILLDAGRPDSPLPSSVQIRQLLWPLERLPLFSPDYLDLMHQLALRQATTPGNILGHVLPSGLRTTKLRLRSFMDGAPQSFSLPELLTLPEATCRRLAEAFCRGEADMIPAHTDPAEGELCLLHTQPPWRVRPQAKRQIALLEYLLEKGTVTRRALLTALGAAAAPALKSLVRQDMIRICPATAEDTTEESTLLPPPPHPFTLSEDQCHVLQALRNALDSGKASTQLLYGITGSGKTAVYLELIRHTLHQGRSAMLLAPEVALALKLQRDTACALPDAPIILFHGYQTASRRERQFRELAARQTPCIVVGTRSALFLPLSRLGLIILDEEHDASYKQDEGVPYQAKEVAWFRTLQSQALLVLGSATPDIKSFHAARTGRLSMQCLPHRVGGGSLPQISLVDIRRQSNTDSLLAPESLHALKETVRRGEQAVVLLNRRGYAHLVYCLECGKVARCPHCEIGLTYHKGRERLVCHYCGYTLPFPAICPQCKSMNYLPLGEGTERLAEQLAPLVGGKVLRLDRDSTRRPGMMEHILESFARQEASILVGTQMLSKGHHFPHVTLALVADGDLGLNLPDYRAAERTFQLLIQSAGRAGRSDKPGKVLIQTRDSSHYCWQYVQKNDFEGFYAEELARRQRRRYPPFVCLGLVRISFASGDSAAAGQLTALGELLRTEGRRYGVTVLGPAPAPLPLLNGRRRFHCLLKAAAWPELRKLYTLVTAQSDRRRLRMSLDLDPVNML